MSLVVVGSVAYDSVETAHGKVDRVLGGSATFCGMASSLLTPTHIVAVVGEDFRPADIDRLRRRGIDTAGIERVPGETFRWGGVYSEHFETRTSLFTELNVFAQFEPKLHGAARSADLAFLANIHPALQLDVLRQVEKPRFVGLDTMGFWIAGEPDHLRDVLREIDCVFVNDEEARMLARTGNVVQAAHRIHDMGPRTVVVKKGEHGATLFHAGRAHHMPAMLLERVIDPTGAGDTFAGGFMGYLATQPDIDADALQGAMVMGTLMASFCCEDFSVDGIERADIDAVLTRHDGLRALMVNLHLDHPRLHAAASRSRSLQVTA
ncbi:MAG: sugar kinase [Myxococcales bacterium]|nr:sugar kinase [Myxococcales bacterium]